MISVRDLIHRYQDRTALNRVSFDVHPAELFGLLAPTGSGTTPLSRILPPLRVPTSGSATIAAFDAVRQPGALRRHIGVVFQAQSVDPKLTAYENLWHQGHLYGLRGPDLKTRINEILSRVGLLDRSNDRVETFSGGMQRRIELAKVNEGNLVALGTPEALTREIGGDVILLEARDPQTLADRIRDTFHLDAAVMDNRVRLEIENGHRFVPDVVEAFPGEIQSLSVSKPTLEDVFIHRTGHRFWNEDAEPSQTTGKKRAEKKSS